MKKLSINNEEFFKTALEILNNEQTVELVISGNSMLPFFKDNQTLVTLKAFDYLKKYDIILFKYQNKYILHRIIKIKDRKLICRGDGLISKEVINKEDVLAKVISYQNKKKIKTNSKSYLFRVYLWMLLRPLRRLIIKTIR